MNTRTNHGAIVPIKRIKQPFTLPTPPPGMKWHHEGGWNDGDLPRGTRPFIEGEMPQKGDFCIADGESVWQESVNWKADMHANSVCRYRTTRPLLFTHEGYEWTWHRAGDPMPCDRVRRVIPLVCYEGRYTTGGNMEGSHWNWNSEYLIAWCYADAPLPIQTLAQDQVELTSEMQEVASQVLNEEMQKPDPYAELKKAHAEGKVIQYRDAGSQWQWLECKRPIWCKDAEYRIKPDEIPWTKWSGGPCPLKDEEVEEWEYKMLDGETRKCTQPRARRWDHLICESDIIAYRVLKWRTPKPKVPLGPENVPPFSAIRRKPEQDHDQQWHWRCVSYVHGIGVQCGNRGYKWEELQRDYQINRSIPLTGKWNPDAWEPCEK